MGYQERGGQDHGVENFLTNRTLVFSSDFQTSGLFRFAPSSAPEDRAIRVHQHHIMKSLRIATLATTCWVGAITCLIMPPLTAAGEKTATFKIENKGLPKHWLQGDPITEMKADKLYLFEFWATWCGPCIAQMPHMEELYQATKDDDNVIIVGVNVFDATPVEKLKSFIARKKITYPVAADGARSGNVAKFWLKPLGITGIPHAIAVRNQELIWHGHPSKLNTKFIQQLSEPGFSAMDVQVAVDKKKVAEAAEKERFLKNVRTVYQSSPENVAEQADKLVAGDHRGAEDVRGFRTAAFSVLFNNGKHKEAQQQLKKLVGETPDHAINLIRVATMIITTDELENKDLGIAVQCLERFIELNPRGASNAYKRMTDAKLMQGDREGAIAAAENAVKTSRPQQKLDAHLKSLSEPKK